LKFRRACPWSGNGSPSRKWLVPLGKQAQETLGSQATSETMVVSIAVLGRERMCGGYINRA
jgi:hypothetical protein